jgi:P-type Cu+ transporter
VVLIGNDLARFVETLAVSRWARRIIWQNFAGTIAIDVGGVALAMLGLIGPVVATQIHVGSELAFILNSARLLPRLMRARAAAPAPLAIAEAKR